MATGVVRNPLNPTQLQILFCLTYPKNLVGWAGVKRDSKHNHNRSPMVQSMHFITVPFYNYFITASS